MTLQSSLSFASSKGCIFHIPGKSIPFEVRTCKKGKDGYWEVERCQAYLPNCFLKFDGDPIVEDDPCSNTGIKVRARDVIEFEDGDESPRECQI